ncbi:hypothetical protein [Neptunomonas sp.]|uniref:hypothetical protein n=1 Tax=Neptunomonas sp. TaxID=1971898 RepID=UPI00356AE37F
MIIEKSIISMSSEHQKSESVSFIQEGNLSGFGQQFVQASLLSGEALAVKGLSGDALGAERGAAFLVMTENGLQFSSVDEQRATQVQQSLTQANLFKALFEAITGTELPVEKAGFMVSDNVIEDFSGGRVQRSAATDFLSEVKTVKMTVNLSRSVEEHEITRFNAGGIVKTSDGVEIGFNMAMTMERHYSSTETSGFTKEVHFKDPLLLNFDGSSAQLSDASFEFDIDADGESEWLGYLAGASGWLGLDKNNNGKIDDGSELFGGKTGQGFEELSRYDDDRNGFIDSADSVFDDLLIWNKTLQADQLLSLGESDVGAIYTGSENSPFDLKGDNNQVIGRVSKSGIYLTEAGDVGSVQQVDMAV